MEPDYRGTYAKINLKAIESNLALVRKQIGKSRNILLPVKADAYGHGLIKVSQYVQKERLVDMLGVASIEEGIELRNAGIDLPILIFGFVLLSEDAARAVLKYKLTAAVGDFASCLLLDRVAKEYETKAQVHLKIDTGMGRLGCQIEEAWQLLSQIMTLSTITVSGIFSHMPVSDENQNNFNQVQISNFAEITSELIKAFSFENRPIRHLANSGATINYKDSYFDMVRPGIISYGYHPYSGMNRLKLEPAMSLVSRIMFTKHVKAGTAISYGHSYTTSKASFISTVACGYGDGYWRSLSNRAKVKINNKFYPVVGRVCMDLILINTGEEELAAGTDVTLFDSDAAFSAEYVADLVNTIPYEVTCRITSRVKRFYIE